MKGRVSKKLAAERKTIIEERQTALSEKRMDRFVGGVFDVLVEEKFEDLEQQDDDGLYLGRIYCQAPEVDGAAVIRSRLPLEPGSMVRGKVLNRAGFDLELSIPAGV
jgi:ribosomal protein S12 methylthiotransferase